MANNFYLAPPETLLWLAIDLDGTLCYPTWTSDQTRSVIGEPIWENVAKLNEAIAAGYIPFIHTARSWTDHDMILAWLKHYNIPITRVVAGKPLAHLYIDDRGRNAGDSSWT